MTSFKMFSQICANSLQRLSQHAELVAIKSLSKSLTLIFPRFLFIYFIFYFFKYLYICFYMICGMCYFVFFRCSIFFHGQKASCLCFAKRVQIGVFALTRWVLMFPWCTSTSSSFFFFFFFSNNNNNYYYL